MTANFSRSLTTLAAVLLGSALLSGCALVRPEGAVTTGSAVPVEAVLGIWEGDVWWEIFGAPSWRGTAALELRPGEDGTFIEDIRIVIGVSAGLIRGTTDYATDILPRYELGASGPWTLAGNFIFVDRGESGEFTAFRINAVTADSLQLGIYLNGDPPRYDPYVLRLHRRADSPPPTEGPSEATLAPVESDTGPADYFGIWRLTNDPPDPTGWSSYPDRLVLSRDGSAEFGTKRGTWRKLGDFIVLERRMDGYFYAFRVSALSGNRMTTIEQSGFHGEFQREAEE